MKIEKVNAAAFGLEEIKAKEIKEKFVEKANELLKFSGDYNKILDSEMSEEICSKAGDLRAKIVKIRTSTDRLHKEEKEDSLKKGRFIDAHRNAIKTVCEGVEGTLKKIENYFVDLQLAAIAKLEAERVALIKPYLEDGVEVPKNLGNMAESVWNVLLAGQKTNFENAQKEKARLEKVRVLNVERKESLLLYWEFVPTDYRNSNLGEIKESEFKALLSDAKKAKADKEAKAALLEKENEKLKKDVETVTTEKKELEVKFKAMPAPVETENKSGSVVLEGEKMKEFIKKYSGFWIIEKDPKTVTKQWIEKNAYQLTFE